MPRLPLMGTRIDVSAPCRRTSGRTSVVPRAYRYCCPRDATMMLVKSEFVRAGYLSSVSYSWRAEHGIGQCATTSSE